MKPQPLTPPDCDLRDFTWMRLDVTRLRDSDLAVLASGDAFRAAVLLWCSSWHQVPAASLPNDDRLLANLAGYGRDMKGWASVRDEALCDFVECSDGRLYHPVVAEKAIEARSQIVKKAARTAAANVAHWGEQSSERGDHKQKRSQRLANARKLGRHSIEEWSALLQVCGHRCVKCGDDSYLCKDHIVPIYKGGSDAIDNLQPMCASCNSAKGSDETDYRPNAWKQCVISAMSRGITDASTRGIQDASSPNSSASEHGVVTPHKRLHQTVPNQTVPNQTVPKREKKNPKTTTVKTERESPTEAKREPPPAAPGSLSEVSTSLSKEVGPKPSRLGSALGTELPEKWTPDDELCDEVKRKFGMTDEDVAIELYAFHAKQAADPIFSNNWRATFVTWCKRWKEHRDKQAPPRVQVSNAAPRRPEQFTESDWDKVAAFYARTGRWQRDAGPDPMSLACQCPRAILKKHGIDERGERTIPPRKADHQVSA